MEHPIALCDGLKVPLSGNALSGIVGDERSWRDYHVHDDHRCVWKLDMGPMGKLYCGCRTRMSTETPGDITSASYFCLHTLWMNYCVFQHVKLPLRPMEKFGIEICPGFSSPASCRRLYINHPTINKLQIQSMNSMI